MNWIRHGSTIMHHLWWCLCRCNSRQAAACCLRDCTRCMYAWYWSSLLHRHEYYIPNFTPQTLNHKKYFWKACIFCAQSGKFCTWPDRFLTWWSRQIFGMSRQCAKKLKQQNHQIKCRSRHILDQNRRVCQRKTDLLHLCGVGCLKMWFMSTGCRLLPWGIEAADDRPKN